MSALTRSRPSRGFDPGKLKTGDDAVDSTVTDMTVDNDAYDNEVPDEKTRPEKPKIGRLPGITALEDSSDVDGVISKMMAEAQAAGHGWSLSRAINNAIRYNLTAPRHGFEAELSQEIARRTHRSTSGFFVPWNLSIGRLEQRSLTTGVGAGAIAAQLPRGMLIDAVRNKLAIARMGGQVLRLTNAPGLVNLPVKSGVITGAWLAEGAAASASNMVVGQVPYRPNTVSATTNVTRRLLSIAAPEFEARIVEDLIVTIASMIDIGALAGTGTNGQPLGAFLQSKFQAITLAADSGNGGKPAYTDIVSAEELLGQINGDSPMDARVGFVTSPQGRSALRRTDLGGTTVTGKFVWKCHPMLIDGEIRSVESVLGYPAVATGSVPANVSKGSGTGLSMAAIGNWADHLTVLFGPLQLIVNPYQQTSAGNPGTIGVSIFQDVDTQFRRWQSLVLIPAIVTT
jgi:HK97 family phage major capsid protein